MKAATRKLRKNYDRLGDLERFRLAVAADARGDDEEARALNRSAPQAVYKMAAYPYGGMWDALLVIGLIASGDVLGYGMFLAWDHALVLAGGPAAEEKESECWGRMKEGARYVLGAWEGLAVFADDLGLEWEHVLRFVPSKPKVDFAVEIAESVLGTEEKTMQAVIEGEFPACADRSAEAEEIRAECKANLQRRREEAAREYADALIEIWKVETGTGCQAQNRGYTICLGS